VILLWRVERPAGGFRRISRTGWRPAHSGQSEVQVAAHTMEKAGLLVADQLAAWIGHASILPPSRALSNPQDPVLGCRKVPINRGCPGFLDTMEKAGLFVADQLAARIGHGAMVALGDITCRPENRLPSRKKFPTNRGCAGSRRCPGSRIVERMNKQPRKCLGWKALYEVHHNVSVAVIL
jgi:hypothetical protein